MRRKLPSTAALAAFEAAARHLSFTRAAEELAVTQSAVCRQVATLEGFLGTKLFRRSQRGVVLTEVGRRYAQTVAARLDAVERDALDAIGQAVPAAAGQLSGALELAVVPTFATQWLLPRLPRLAQAQPGITVHLTSRTRPFLFDGSGLDAAIHASASPWPGTEGLPLLPEDLMAVAAPALLAGRKRWQPADLLRLPLLQASTRPYAWRQWFASAGVRHVQDGQDLAGPRMELFSLLAEAAAQGLGVALLPRLLVERELAAGRLAQATPHVQRGERTYHLLYPSHRVGEPVLAAFADWLAQEVRAYQNG
ncbi:MAG: LysR family transcriptional regulator [Proteobacteria bacterium]|nr:LysR family transcriptional regulator [Pseudomonadota bacterium]